MDRKGYIRRYECDICHRPFPTKDDRFEFEGSTLSYCRECWLVKVEEYEYPIELQEIREPHAANS